jgi:hypothetical protein
VTVEAVIAIVPQYEDVALRYDDGTEFVLGVLGRVRLVLRFAVHEELAAHYLDLVSLMNE